MGVFFKNADITIYSHYFDKTTKVDKYKRIVIEDVNWNSKRNATVSDKGVNIADTTLIIMDKLENYIDSVDYNNLSDTTNYFTINIGDKIIKGIGVEITRIADLNKYMSVTVVAIRESSLFGTLEVECK